MAIVMLMCHVVTFAQQQDDCFVVSKINVTGNKVTKWSTMERELLFHEGDTVCSLEAIKQSRENLLNTSLFNFVDFDWSDESEIKSAADKITQTLVGNHWIVLDNGGAYFHRRYSQNRFLFHLFMGVADVDTCA